MSADSALTSCQYLLIRLALYVPPVFCCSSIKVTVLLDHRIIACVWGHIATSLLDIFWQLSIFYFFFNITKKFCSKFGRSLWTVFVEGGVFLSRQTLETFPPRQPSISCWQRADERRADRCVAVIWLGFLASFTPPPNPFTPARPLPPPPMPLLLSAKDYRAGRKFNTHL